MRGRCVAENLLLLEPDVCFLCLLLRLVSLLLRDLRQLLCFLLSLFGSLGKLLRCFLPVLEILLVSDGCQIRRHRVGIR